MMGVLAERKLLSVLGRKTRQEMKWWKSKVT